MATSVECKPVQIPSFKAFNITQWFEEVEQEFLSSGVTNDSSKFGYIVTHLYSICFPVLQRIIMNPPVIGKYEKLKKEVIMHYTLLHDDDNLRRLYRRYQKIVRENEEYISQNIPDYRTEKSRPSCSTMNNKKFYEIELCRMLN